MEGFKSFAGRVELPFPGALIAIVGPNGAGKSNICDAIAWVLGEQSARLLRSQTMADVIFAGSPTRPPLGAAEVGISIAADDGRWSATGGTLDITRRVFRDGTSEYRLQGRRVRLKDVMDALFDAGLGTRAYAIIEQGRIGQVLSLRANERRALFEEAAGITKFRARRHEAELKLAETRANLLRITDIASEVRRSLEAVRKQARRAEHAAAIRDELLATRAALLAGRRQAALAALADRQAAVAEAARRELDEAARLAGAEAALAQARQRLDLAQAALAEARRDAAEANAAAQRREAEEAAARRELAEAEARSAQAEEETARLEVTIREMEAVSDTVAAAVAAARAGLADAEAALAAAEAEAARAAEEAQRVASRAEERRRDLLAALAAAGEARAHVHRLEVELEQNRFQAGRLAAEGERLRGHLEALAGAEREASQRLENAEARVATAEAARQELRQRQAELKRASAECAHRRDAAAHARWQARHEREGIERQLAAAKALPQALARALPTEAVRGTVADFLAPPAELAPALDRAYGELLSLPVLADRDALARLAEALPRLEGRVEVVVADPSATPRPSPLLAAAGVGEGDLGWLSRALPRATLAESDAEVERLAAEDPDLVVVPPGRGRRRGTRADFVAGTTQPPGVLELRNRVREAAAAEAAAAAEEERLVAELAALGERTAAVEADLASQDEENRRAAEAAAAARLLAEARHRERLRLERELEALAGESARLDEETEALARRLEVARSEADRLAARATELERGVDEVAAQAQDARQRDATAAAAAERARSAVALSRERLAAALREEERHQRDLEALAARGAAAAAERADQQARAVAARQAVAAARADLATLLAAHAEAARRVEVGTEQESSARHQVSEAEAAAETARRAHAAAREAVHAAELALADARAELARIEETAALALGEAAMRSAEPPAPDALPELQAREARLAAQLAELGPVNELAVTERAALEERHAFLRAQMRDLERSLESLAGTIRELDETCAARFLATLEEASQSFGEVFRTLFAGGDAYLELADPSTPLDSGIEVRVRPPGKHAQSVLLLSGGEKALAAIALLLALFRIRPAPFCVLDEVDAPLDDSNVERLCRLLREMSTATQFILITHNRRTMAHADVLYGVTMEEPGVSRIVSVRLEE